MRIGIYHEMGHDGASNAGSAYRWVDKIGTRTGALAADYAAYWQNYVPTLTTWIGTLSYATVDHVIGHPFGIQGKSLGNPEFFGYSIAQEQKHPNLQYLWNTFFPSFLTPLTNTSGTRTTILLGSLGADTYEIEPTGDSGGSSADEYRPASYYERLRDQEGVILAKAVRDELKLYQDRGVHLAFDNLQGAAVNGPEYATAAFWKYSQNNAGKALVGGGAHRYDTEDYWDGTPSVLSVLNVWDQFDPVDTNQRRDPVGDAANFNSQYSANADATYATDPGLVVLIGVDDVPEGESLAGATGSTAWLNQKSDLIADVGDLFGSAYVTVCLAEQIIKAYSDAGTTASAVAAYTN